MSCATTRWLRPLAVFLVACIAATAPGAEYEEGVHYQKLPVAVETRDPDKIEVVEIFSYACIHCYRLEPLLEAWQRTQPDDVDFYRLHLVTRRLQAFAQTFFAAEALGVLERVHQPLFAAIHDYGIDVSRPQYARRLFLREADVDEERFQKAFDSFGVQGRVRQADALARAYKVMATPTLVVNGRYVTETAMAGSPQAMFLVANHLVAKEREARR